MIKPFILCAAALAAAPAFAAPQAECDLKITSQGNTLIGKYDALAGGSYIEQIRLKVRNDGSGQCNAFFTVSNTLGLSSLDGPQSDTLAYSIVDQADSSTVIYDPVTNQSQAVPFTVGPKMAVELNPRLLVPGSQPGRSGKYSATLGVAIATESTAVARASDATFTVGVDVTPSAQANFVGAVGRDASLDLGELEPGKSQSIGLQVRASTDVDVNISSENLGFLALKGGKETGIPYTMTLDGQSVELADAGKLELILADPVRGRTTPVAVTVGSFNRMPPGDYRDVVTFRISAR